MHTHPRPERDYLGRIPYTPPEPDEESDRYLLNYLASRIWRDKTGRLRVRRAYLRERRHLQVLVLFAGRRKLTIVPGRYLPRPKVVRPPRARVSAIATVAIAASVGTPEPI